VTDSRMKGRGKGLLGGTSRDNDQPEPAVSPSDPDAQRKALQVLILAQRTADEHLANAQREADKIWAAARATAEQIARDTQTHAENARRDAGKALAEARATADQIARDARAHAESVRRDADEILADAQARAAEIVKDAEENAEKLEREAQQAYEEALGGLTVKRAALEKQIEALQKFDREYRARLRTFMQNQLLALGLDEPAATAESQQLRPAAATAPSPTQDG
jgi:cell division septum initiation protein DivIVA